MKNLTRNIFPGLLGAIIILILMGLPGSCFPKVQTFWEWLSPDKIVHLIVFGIFAFLSIWGYRDYYCRNNKRNRNKIVILTFLITIGYGGVTELLQKYVFIGRYGSVYDFFADVIGCILGIIIFIWFFRKKISVLPSESQ